MTDDKNELNQDIILASVSKSANDGDNGTAEKMDDENPSDGLTPGHFANMQGIEVFLKQRATEMREHVLNPQLQVYNCASYNPLPATNRVFLNKKKEKGSDLAIGRATTRVYKSLYRPKAAASAHNKSKAATRALQVSQVSPLKIVSLH